MPHNPASIVRLLYGEHYRRKNRAEAFSLNPATNSLTSALPIGQGQSMLRSRFPDLVVDLLPFEIVAQSITSLRRQTIGNPRSVLPTSPFLDSFRISDNPGVEIATSGLSQADYGAENGAGKRWV